MGWSKSELAEAAAVNTALPKLGIGGMSCTNIIEVISPKSLQKDERRFIVFKEI
jgi:hypothetical protein